MGKLERLTVKTMIVKSRQLPFAPGMTRVQWYATGRQRKIERRILTKLTIIAKTKTPIMTFRVLESGAEIRCSWKTMEILIVASVRRYVTLPAKVNCEEDTRQLGWKGVEELVSTNLQQSYHIRFLHVVNMHPHALIHIDLRNHRHHYR